MIIWKVIMGERRDLIHLLKEGKLVARKREGKTAVQSRDKNEAGFEGRRNLRCFREQNNLPSVK